ncbi:HAD family hydrolase [Mammaliicoccus fleurettii]|uniref:HAD family hydrolase n=1 Tax=Mammaliicoccus fleurettii TaxID=150056 RepID=UPI002DB6E5BA|nr:HAD family hydrolase [Mammaliicoccus fleurettii]MEB7805749.1 HAD family hydrolase [Mammaliicoccus fleurettii]
MFILFDLDDTLYDLKHPFKKSINELFSKINVDINQLFYYFRKYSDSKFELTQTGKMSIKEMHIYRITKALEVCGLNISNEEAIQFQRTYEKYQYEITLTKEIINVLDYCYNHQEIQIGIITNGEKDRQWNKIKTLELLRWFPKDSIFISGEIGFSKPDKKLFDIVELKLNLKKKETYYIGDSYNNDVMGSYNVGWNAIWLNKRNLRLHEKLNISKKIIYEEKELLQYIKSLN